MLVGWEERRPGLGNGERVVEGGMMRDGEF